MTQLLKRFANKPLLWVFLFCLAAIQGPAFSLMDNFNQQECVDCKTYLGLATGDFNQSPIRRYRPIVPALAATIHAVAAPAFTKLQPKTFPGDFGWSVSFFLVNTVLLSIWGVVIYLFSLRQGIEPLYALAGLIVLLTCRWTPYIAGTPIADSLYCLVTGMALLSLYTNSWPLTIAVLFIGPFAKEAFVFIAPIIVLFTRLPRLRIIALLLLSAALVGGYRYMFDKLVGLPPTDGLAADLDHLNYIALNTRKLLTFHGLYDTLSNWGFWLLFPLWALRSPSFRSSLRLFFTPAIITFMLVILLHMILSSSFERMFFLAMPILCTINALAFRSLFAKIVP